MSFRTVWGHFLDVQLEWTIDIWNRMIFVVLCGLVKRSGQGMNLIYELSIKEAKQLPSFSGTDENFVCINLNGVVLDTKMLSLINQIGNERMETLSTGDFLGINALYPR